MIFFHPVLAKLPQNAIELVKSLETFKIWNFFEKIEGFSEKKMNFCNFAQGGKFAVECVSNDMIS